MIFIFLITHNSNNFTTLTSLKVKYRLGNKNKYVFILYFARLLLPLQLKLK